MIQFARRITRLGTETAFAVSAEASAFAAQGQKVYSFHLGDMNFPTPQNIVEATMRAIRDGKTCYCANAGIPQLREVLADDINASHSTRYSADNIVIQPGGKPTIGKFIMALMNPGAGLFRHQPARDQRGDRDVKKVLGLVLVRGDGKYRQNRKQDANHHSGAFHEGRIRQITWIPVYHRNGGFFNNGSACPCPHPSAMFKKRVSESACLGRWKGLRRG